MTGPTWIAAYLCAIQGHVATGVGARCGAAFAVPAGCTDHDPALDAITWYVRCLEDVQDGKVVRGLCEAKAGYDAALDRLAAAAVCSNELAHAREQLVRQRNHYAVLSETAEAQRDTLIEAASAFDAVFDTNSVDWGTVVAGWLKMRAALTAVGAG